MPLLVASRIKNKITTPANISKVVVSPPLIAISSQEKIIWNPVKKDKKTKKNLNKLSKILLSDVWRVGLFKNNIQSINIRWKILISGVDKTNIPETFNKWTAPNTNAIHIIKNDLRELIKRDL